MKKAILFLCGSFNPITAGHRRLAERAYEFVESSMDLEVERIFFSPAHGSYKFKKLIDSTQRKEMIQLAIQSSLLASKMEVNEEELFSPTGPLPTYAVAAGLAARYPGRQLLLVSGADLLQGMLNPQYWPEANVRRLFASCGLVVCLRRGLVDDLDALIAGNDLLNSFSQQIYIIHAEVGEESSSAVRAGNLEYLDPAVREFFTANIPPTK